MLGPALVDRYGALDQYTVMQIQATAEKLKLGTRYLAYAVALYRYDESENTINILRVDQAFLDQLREEIAASWFDGDLDYRSEDVLRLSKTTTTKFAIAPDWRVQGRGHTSL